MHMLIHVQALVPGYRWLSSVPLVAWVAPRHRAAPSNLVSSTILETGGREIWRRSCYAAGEAPPATRSSAHAHVAPPLSISATRSCGVLPLPASHPATHPAPAPRPPPPAPRPPPHLAGDLTLAQYLRPNTTTDASERPYRRAGLTGEGEIVGVGVLSAVRTPARLQ